MLELDVLDYIAMADESKKLGFSRQTHNLDGAYDFIEPINPKTGQGKWNHIKSSRGYPWDIKLFDGNFIYDWLTEWKWDDPTSYKKFVRNRVVSNVFVDGLLCMPRHLNEGFNAPPSLFTPSEKSSYWIYPGNCISDKKVHYLGDVYQYLHGPYFVDNGGDIGFCQTLFHTYIWGKTREDNTYALNHGWTRWSESNFNPVTGLYELNKRPDGSLKLVVKSHILKGGTNDIKPKPVNFPCG